MTGGSGLALNFAAACAHHFEPQRTRWGLGLLTYSVFLTRHRNVGVQRTTNAAR